MTRSRFEAINAFFHVVTPQDEAANSSDPLKKVRKFYDAVKAKCLELYQPLQQLSVDERMVKSKARTHFRQFIRNKPTKWGFKFWVLADSTGFTSDCSLYCGKQRGRPISDNGLAFDVVTDILHTFDYQGYSVYFDNLYTSPTLLHALKEKKFSATGTLRTNRRGIPSSVLAMKVALSRADVPRGTGYYIRDSDDLYVCWRDNNCVCIMSNEHPGHSEGMARRAAKTSTGAYQTADVPLPATVKYYNQFMGGVDKSDQLISYHRILRQTKKYWKTIFTTSWKFASPILQFFINGTACRMGRKHPLLTLFGMMWFLPSLKNLEIAVRLAPSLMILHHIIAQLQSKNSERFVLFATRSAHAIALTVLLDLACVKQQKDNAMMYGTALNMQKIEAVGSPPRSRDYYYIEGCSHWANVLEDL